MPTKTRIIALLLVVFSAAFFAYTVHAKSTQYSNIIDRCDWKGSDRSIAIRACSALLNVQGISDDSRHVLLTNRSRAYKQNGEYENALIDINHALELQPENVTTWVYRAITHAAKNDMDAAMKDFEAALALEQDRVTTLDTRALIHVCNGQYEKASQDFERIFELDPSYETSPLVHEIVSDTINEDYDQLIEHLEQYDSGLESPVSGLLERLGILYYQYSNDYEQALQAFLELAESMPTYPAAQLYLGATYLKLGDENLGHKYIDLYVKSALQKSRANDTLYDRLAGWIGSWIIPTGSIETAVRGTAYAKIGQRDFARLEFTAFLENAGHFSVKAMSTSFERHGIPFNESWATEIDDEFYIALDKYIDQFEDYFSLQTIKTAMQDICDPI